MEIQSELLGVDLVLRDILVKCDDESLRKGLTKGYYISLINQALERLSLVTFYNEEPPMDSAMPENLRWQLPTNFFNISQLYAFNGDCCNVENSANIYWKRNFNNAPDGVGYTALNKGYQQQGDPYFSPWGITGNMVGGDSNISAGGQSSQQSTINTGGGVGNEGERLLYANVQNGFLMFSSSCQAYSSFRVIYNGYGGVIGDKPLIPRPLRAVVIDLVVLEAFTILMTRNPKSVYGGMIKVANDTLYNKQYGSWWEAQSFVRQSSTWQKNMRELYGSSPINAMM